MSLEQSVIAFLDDQDEHLSYLAQQIWDKPEIALQESFACNLLATEIEAAGFTVERNIGDMPTAFVASWGSGAPIIGILGEYDALPSLSQKLTTEHDPVVSGGPGHGCGHNLFGVASFAAAVSLKKLMEEQNIPGTIRFYGCPAEETIVGKTFMARAGAFNDLDAALAWHPGDINQVWANSSQAMNSFKVNFYGVSSHAAADPHNGRSALDAALLMDVGVNYLREHIIQEARIHSVITNGGLAPNVVPNHAQIWYFVRTPRREQVAPIYQRVLNIAKGAALMTDTTYDIDFLTGCYHMLSNQVLSTRLYENMKKLDPIEFSEEEKTFAKKLQATFTEGALDHTFAHLKKQTPIEIDDEKINEPLWSDVLPHKTTGESMPGSTEVADVSHITPTAQMSTVCWPLGTPGHSWQVVASSGSSIGMKGMLFAAKTLALTALDLFTDAELLQAAKDEFKRDTKGKPYVSPLPEDAFPH